MKWETKIAWGEVKSERLIMIGPRYKWQPTHKFVIGAFLVFTQKVERFFGACCFYFCTRRAVSFDVPNY